jgi:large subunit ribosomal protein L13
MTTFQPKAKEVKRNWHLVDAKGQVLGRMASDIAKLLMGKHKATYSAHMDSGDYVVVTNAKEVVLTGRKTDQKIYYRHSGFPGGLKEVKFKQMQERFPERVVEFAVSGMLPKNKLRDDRMKRLKVFAEGNHKYDNKFVKNDK